MATIPISLDDLDLQVLAEPNGMERETARLAPIVLDRFAAPVVEAAVSVIAKRLPPDQIAAAKSEAKSNFMAAHTTPEKRTELESAIRYRITELTA